MKQNPGCLSGTGLEAVGPEILDAAFVRAAVVDGHNVVFSTIDHSAQLSGTGPSSASIWSVAKGDGAAMQIATDQSYPYRAGYPPLERQMQVG